jgi:hypothetical protein
MLFSQDSTKVIPLETEEVSMITNRPGATESSTAVFKGGFQTEIGFEYGKIPEWKGSTEHIEYLFLPSFGFLYGVSENVELRVFSTNYATRSNVNGGYTKLVFNLSTIYVGSKINLFKENRFVPNAALLINQGVPSNYVDVRRQWPTSAIFAWSYTLPANFGLSGNLGYINHKEVFQNDITFDHSWSYTLNLGYSIKDDLGVFAEIFGEGKMNDNGETPLNIDGGVWYRINKKLQVDASASYGFEVENYYLNMGFSWLLIK